MEDKPPAYDESGLNVLDPHDARGVKSKYITLLQEKALMKHLPNGSKDNLAVDLGCGFGRLSGVMSDKGWEVVGIEPTMDLLKYAQAHYSGVSFCRAKLPGLPLADESVDLLLIHNVLRSFMKMGCLDAIKGVGRYVSTGGCVAVVDNVRVNHPDFLKEEDITKIMENEGLRLDQVIPIRAGRWWMIYLIRYGFVPESWLERIADYELKLREKSHKRYRWQYLNIVFLFRKAAGN